MMKNNKTIQIRVNYRECLNKTYGSYEVRTLKIRSKGYAPVTVKDPYGLNVLECVDEYINKNNFPNAHIQVVRDAYIQYTKEYEIHNDAVIISDFDLYRINIARDDNMIEVDLSEYGL